MPLSYEGSITLGQAIPMAATAAAELDTAIGLTVPDVQARVDGLLALSVSVPPSTATLIANLQGVISALGTLGSLPSIDLSGTLAALAELQTLLAQLQASLAFSANLGTLLAGGGIHYYVYAGPVDQMGPGMTSLLSGGLPGGTGGAQNVAGVVLLAGEAGAISALQTVLKS